MCGEPSARLSRGLRFRCYRHLLNRLLNHLSFKRGGVLGMAQACDE